MKIHKDSDILANIITTTTMSLRVDRAVPLIARDPYRYAVFPAG